MLKVYVVPYWRWGNFGYVDPVSAAGDGPHRQWDREIVTTTSRAAARDIVAKARNPNGFGRITVAQVIGGPRGRERPQGRGQNPHRGRSR